MNTTWTDVDFCGERLCLDFVNTASHWNDPERFEERLKSFGDLMSWLSYAATQGRDEIRWRITFDAADEEIQKRVMADARDLRAALHSIFSGIIRGGVPDPAALSRVYGALATAVTFVKPHDESGGGGWANASVDIVRPSGLIYPIAYSATRLLVEDCLCYVKECGAETCDWIFLDCSKSHRRRWCDMKTCGNRHKARKHYKKKCEGEVC